MSSGSRRVVGVLGGMGPMATVETFRRIVLATPAATDQDHLHVIIDSDPSIPDRTRALVSGGQDPRPRLEASAQRLAAAGAEIICMPCNTAHAYHPWLQVRVPVPIVHMLEETSAAARASSFTTFGLLATTGTVHAGLYQDVFEREGLRLLTPSEATQAELSSVITAIKAGRLGATALDRIETAARELAEDGVESFIVGCTELSLLAPRLAASHPVIDALDVLVRSTVTQALRDGPLLHPALRPEGTDDVA